VPPLRERKADIPLLAMFFLNRFRTQYGKRANHFSNDALARLRTYDWPGNVRELENRVQQLVVLSTGEVVHDVDVDTEGMEQAAPVDLTFKEAKRRVVVDFEREFIERALVRSGGNVSEAARSAGLDRKSFWVVARRVGVTKGNA
jgi:two-component system response regulator GlrR